MGTPVMCGAHDYMGFEPCPRCKTAVALAVNVLVEARVLREIYATAMRTPGFPGSGLDMAVKRVADAIGAYDASPETRTK